MIYLNQINVLTVIYNLNLLITIIIIGQIHIGAKIVLSKKLKSI
jgi:hypothetical protein